MRFNPLDPFDAAPYVRFPVKSQKTKTTKTKSTTKNPCGLFVPFHLRRCQFRV